MQLKELQKTLKNQRARGASGLVPDSPSSLSPVKNNRRVEVPSQSLGIIKFELSR